MTLTIVSGAAPGVEQGAIEAAVNLALHWQGWASEQSILAIPPVYRTGLQPTSATDAGMVRRLNIQGCDGALVFSTSMVLAGVPAFVDRWTERMGRAFLHVTLNPAGLRSPLPAEVVERVRAWLRDLPGRVYVTGPSADDVPGIQGAVRDALIAILEPFAVEEVRQTARQIGLLGDLVEVPWPRQPPGDLLLDRAGDIVPVDCRGEPLDLGPDQHERNMAALGFGPPGDRHRLGPDDPPEGLDDLQRAQLDASIREAERDIRDPVEERMRAYHHLAATAPGPIGGGYHDDEDDEPPAPGDQTA